MNRRAAFEIVDQFERALCEYTGAPYAIAVDSCTNAIFLSLLWANLKYRREQSHVETITTPIVQLPAHNYIGVVQAAKNAGYQVELVDLRWHNAYAIRACGVTIWDAAKDFHKDCYISDSLYCVSFQAAKRLPIGRGGTILHDDPDFNAWACRARFDGRSEGDDYKNPSFTTPGFHMYLTPDAAARGLWLLTYLEDDDQGNWTEYPDLRKFLS